MRRAARTDTNHADIRDGLRRAGYPVFDLSKVGGGYPDLMVMSKARDPMFVLMECKTKKGKFTPAQVKFHATYKHGPLLVPRSLDAALLGMEQYDQIRFD